MCVSVCVVCVCVVCVCVVCVCVVCMCVCVLCVCGVCVVRVCVCVVCVLCVCCTCVCQCVCVWCVVCVCVCFVCVLGMSVCVKVQPLLIVVTGCNGTYSMYGPANGAMALHSRNSVNMSTGRRLMAPLRSSLVCSPAERRLACLPGGYY